MTEYNASSIQVYKGLSAVRKRPGMYIGNTDDGSGLHRMIFEVVDNSIDESLAGYCTKIKIVLFKNNFISVFDNGRGMPIDLYKNYKKPAAEVIMTILHSGAKFNEKFYKLSGGLHGVGVSVVNALSEKLKLIIFRSGLIYEQIYSYGKPKNDLNIIGHTDKRGTEIKFLCDYKIFKHSEFNNDILCLRFKELTYLNPLININLQDKRSTSFKNLEFKSKDGIFSFINNTNEKNLLINEEVISFSGEKYNVNVNIVMQWTNSFKEKTLCYTNNIFQKDGGTHFLGFKIGIIKVIKDLIKNRKLENKNLIIGDDVKEGLMSVLSIYMPNPKFSSQTKDKLISSEVKNVLEDIVGFYLKDYFIKNPEDFNLLLNKILISVKSREAAQKARDLIRKKNDLDGLNLFNKLSDCQEKNPVFSELFLVEGDSAGGSAKQARDRKFQAILPLKGKILNVEKSGLDKMLSNSEIKSIISVLKHDINKFSFEKRYMRYNKIIFMTDADVDGSHIRTLLMTFFYKHLLWIINSGHIFISKPPLYKIQKIKKIIYIRDKLDFNDFLFEEIFNNLIKAFKIDYLFLRELINLYKLVFLKMENISFKYPHNFFKYIIYCNNQFFIENKIQIKTLSFYEFLLNNLIEDNCKFLFDDFFLDNDLCFSDIKNNIYKNYRLDFGFFYSLEYLLLKKINFALNLLFKKKKKNIILKQICNFYKFDNLIESLKVKTLNKYNVQRYKGLGEMNADQLWFTTMNPDTRNLQQLKIKDMSIAGKIIAKLMGGDINERRKFIEKNSISIFDLDI